jgi:protocatechuate 3,4-dioxygenase beta subunit
MISKHRLLLVLLLAFSGTLFAQQKYLITSRHSSYYSYIYRITDREARIINRKSIYMADYSYLHTLVDSLKPDQEPADISLMPGNYLQVAARENKLTFDYFNVCDYSVQILDNKKDLCVQILSKKDCSPVTDAEVKIRNTRVPFDEKSLTYRLKTTDKQGLLTVTLNGNSSFHRISRELRTYKLKRIYYAVCYRSPLKYVYKPVYNLVALPVYAVRNLVTYDYYNPAWNYFRYRTRKIVSVFSPDNYYNSRYSSNDYTGYLVFSKPMFRPGDTVNLKAFIIRSRDGKPLKGNVYMYLQKRYDYGNRNRIFLGELSPYAPGGYSSHFIIADSLKMILDNDYEILLTKPGKNGDRLISGNFKYRDYELNRNALKVSVDKINQWRGEPFAIHVTAKDDNGNAVPDCRLELKLETNRIFRYYRDRLFIPNLLLEKTIPLLNGNADVVIPDSVMPDVQMTYDITATVLSSDNEKMKWDTTVTYESHPEYLSIIAAGDSIRFTCTAFGLNKEVEAEITGFDENDDELFSRKVTLPYTEPLNRLCSGYEVTSEGIDTESLHMEKEKPQLTFFGEDTGDSLFIASSNPRNIPFSWYLYKGNSLIDHGFDKNLNYSRKNNIYDTYTLTYQFTWAGKVVSDAVAVAKQQNHLNIHVDQPSTVYPGQETEVSLTVTDSKGKPVPGVDLTCYGITHKFGAQQVSVPSYNNKLKGLQRYNSFNLNDINDYRSPSTSREMQLDYAAFRERYGLDTIEYYHFLYPGDTIYTYTYPAVDEITQVAPFIVHNGEVQPIRVLYIDSYPYYFNWVDVKEPYSFRVSSGYHTFRFILRDKEIKIESLIYCKYGHKTIFSFDEDLKAAYIKTVKRDTKFSDAEITKLSRYVFAYRGISTPGKNSYLEQYQRIIPLQQQISKSYTAGPLGGGLTWFRVPGQMLQNFDPEPGFEYEFLPGVIKMRSKKPEQLVYGSNDIRSELNDQVYTLKRQTADDIALSNSLRRSYVSDIDISNRTGNSELRAQLDSRFYNEKLPLNILLINCDSTSGNIYLNGRQFTFKRLNPARYCMMLLFEDDSYFYSDTINVKPDGINFLRIGMPEHFRTDSIGKKISETIVQNIRNTSLKKELGQQSYFRSLVDESKVYTGEGFVCKGKVIDKSSGEPVPFATILVPDTKYGTVSDFDGNFEFNVPLGTSSIRVAFVGYNTTTVNIIPWEFCLVNLVASATSLEEVVVTGYGISHIDKDRTVSGSIVTAQEIAKMPARSADVVATTVGGVFSAYGEVGSIRGQRTDGDVTYIDGIRVRGAGNIYGLSEYNLYEISSEYGNNSILTLKGLPGKGMPEFFSSIRSKFSDCAYWEPTLRTDENGKAVFKVKYPDDITCWDTYVLAMNGKKQSGMATAPVFSYKPFIAQLFMPRFMVEGDTVKALGKAINYTPDTLSVTTVFELNGVKYGEHESRCSSVVIDSMIITSTRADTLKVKYLLTKSDGYFDGEIRELPVKPFGVEESEGVFMIFDHDTTFTLPQGPGGGSYSISADADYLDLMRSDIRGLRYYPYLCNEQLASKLTGLLAEQKICKYIGEKFAGEKDINKIIQKLVKNQNEHHGWGWWDVSNTVPWITEHVINALLDAGEAGYEVKLDTSAMVDDLVYLFTKVSETEKLDYFYILSRIKADVNYREMAGSFKKPMYLTTAQQLQLIEIKQANNLPYSLDSMMKMSHRTIFGNFYWGNENLRYNLFENTVEATLRAYRILEKDIAGRQYLPRVRAYLIGQRKHNGWMNTYQCANIIETLLPSLLSDGEKPQKPVLTISGPATKEVTTFPFTTEISSTVPLQITTKGNVPVYFTAFSKKWNNDPLPG